jgi:hypothetical protein
LGVFILDTSKAIKDRANATLLDSLSAVQAAIQAMPVSGPRNLREAFSLSDPVLSMLDKQLADARSQMAKLVNAFGLGDAMAGALKLQIAALEIAYAQRMAAIRKKREDRERSVANDTHPKKDEAKIFAPQKRKRRSSETTNWLLWVLLLMDNPRRPPALKAA